MAASMTSARMPSVQLAGVDVRLVLGADHDGVHPGRTAVLVVLDRHLALAIGPQEGERPISARFCQPAGDGVGELDRHRHQLRRLIGRVAEHHSLVAGAELVRLEPQLRLQGVVHAAADVGALLLDGRDGPARLPVEPEVARVVPDVPHRAADHRLDVHVVAGRHLAQDEDQSGGGHLDRAPRVGSLAMTSSRIASAIWSQSLSGCPSVTDSEVNRVRFAARSTGRDPPGLMG